MRGAEAASLPTGAVTFLLPDIEGSTRGWEANREQMTTAVARHYELLNEAIARHRGVRPQKQGEGDTVVAAFARPSDALLAALNAQLTLSTEEAGLAVRMAVHTGEVELQDASNYFGPVSEAVHHVVHHAVPAR